MTTTDQSDPPPFIFSSETSSRRVFRRVPSQSPSPLTTAGHQRRMASAYSGQAALLGLPAAPPAGVDVGAGPGGNVAAGVTLDSYVPPQCLWSSNRGGKTSTGGEGIVVYKVSSVSRCVDGGRARDGSGSAFVPFFVHNIHACMFSALLTPPSSTRFAAFVLRTARFRAVG